MVTLFLLALAFHLTLVISRGGGFWNRYTFDSVATHGRRGWDFYAVYQAGHNALHGHSVYRQNPDVEIVVPWHTPYRYLPVLAYIIGVPLQALESRDALILWMIIVDLLLIGCALHSWRRYGEWRGVLAASMWLLFTPYYLEFYLGQFTFVQTVFIYGMLIALENESGGGALDLWWQASLLWKHNTLLLTPLMLRLRRWKALLGMAALSLLSAVYLWVDPLAWKAFRGNFLSGAPTHRLGDHGARQWLFSISAALFPQLSDQGHLLIQGIWVASIVSISLIATSRARRDRAPELFCLWIASFFLVYHDVWEHHYVMLVPIYVVLYQRMRSWPLLVLYLITAVWTPYVLMDPQGLAAYHMPMRWTSLDPPILDVLYHASKALPTLLLWGYLVRSTLLETFFEEQRCSIR